MTPIFETPGDLAVELFDRALEPGMTGRERLRLAVAAAVFARRKWREEVLG